MIEKYLNITAYDISESCSFDLYELPNLLKLWSDEIHLLGMHISGCLVRNGARQSTQIGREKVSAGFENISDRSTFGSMRMVKNALSHKCYQKTNNGGTNFSLRHLWRQVMFSPLWCQYCRIILTVQDVFCKIL